MYFNHTVKSFPPICMCVPCSGMLKIKPFPATSLSFQKWHEEIAAYRDEVEEVGGRAQEILDERRVSSRLGWQATQLTSRYQALLLQVLVRSDSATSCSWWSSELLRPNVPPLTHFQEDTCVLRKALAQGCNSLFNIVFSFKGTNSIPGGRDPEFGGIRIIPKCLF